MDQQPASGIAVGAQHADLATLGAHEPAQQDVGGQRRGEDFRDQQPYTVPFRCLYSRNISNLMMAGKHISVTHVAGSVTKYMGNGAQHGIATAVAADLCIKLSTTPRGLYEEHLEELQRRVEELTACDHENVAFP